MNISWVLLVTLSVFVIDGVVLSDKFIDQSMFTEKSVNDLKEIKTILSINGFRKWWDVKEGTETFVNLKCAVNTCRLTVNWNERYTADMILYQYEPYWHDVASSPTQVKAFIELESPMHGKRFINSGFINWTITYRHDSTIPVPYGEWIYYDPHVKQKFQSRNYAKYKTKKVAWIVSNCKAKNYRLEYALELQNYIQVDIYGNCGTLKCQSSLDCHDILDRDYKFYLAFENSNCKEYITEKFFRNALMRNTLPIVMGARREDYEKYAPFRSYIHVEDFESPEKLAEYLHILDRNDDLYNEYFKWKGTGQIIDTKTYLWCRICAKLHDEDLISSHQHYDDINEWWGPTGVCSSGTNIMLSKLLLLAWFCAAVRSNSPCF